MHKNIATGLLLVVFLLNLLTVAPAAALSVPPEGPDDAGSGRDAPDLPPSGVALQEGRFHQAAFDTPADRWDWYAVALDHAATLHVEVHAQAACVRAQPVAGHPVAACASPGRPASLWVTSAAGVVDIGVEGGLMEGYAIVYTLNGFAPRPQHAPSLDDDAGSGRDAPDLAIPLVPVRGGEDHTAAGGQIVDDLEDWYVLDVPKDSVVTVTGWSRAGACFDLVPAREARRDMPCDLRPADPVAEVEARLDDDVWYLRVGSVGGVYGFSVTTR